MSFFKVLTLTDLSALVIKHAIAAINCVKMYLIGLRQHWLEKSLRKE